MTSHPLVTFVIPSTGRPTLERTLESLHGQTEDGWRAIVLFDGCPPTVSSDEQVQVVPLAVRLGGAPNFAGKVRNVGLGLVTTPWVAFVDDDDALDRYYVNLLQYEALHQPELDFVVFRMQYEDNFTLPPQEDVATRMLRPDYVGISFAIRMDFLRRHRLEFCNAQREDFELLDRMMHLTDHYRISPHITYYVRHWRESVSPHQTRRMREIHL